MRLKVCLFVLFFWRAHAKKGETVLIHGASGAVSVWKTCAKKKFHIFLLFSLTSLSFLNLLMKNIPTLPHFLFHTHTHTESVYHTHAQQIIWFISWVMNVELHSSFISFKFLLILRTDINHLLLWTGGTCRRAAMQVHGAESAGDRRNPEGSGPGQAMWRRGRV